ncbi:hypothetical protein DY596_11805 [Listeria monocytogenes]|nr:hypothetical protein [Listeria monocytogenes]EEY3878521.1 hypothetical protein [Listeria monocytogenes]EHY2315964.1 hypothetical protein [Listeria monocytogenes]EIZ0328066.1 hypothetical protein [Listeria monocytogenes]EJB1033671.1 hypothetical protein [Listeria monocytogenes]
MSELIKVFKYDDNGVFERDDLIILKKGEKIPDGYTLIEPPVPAINPVFNTKKQKWSSGEEASIPEPPELTELEKLTQDNANLLLSLAEAGVL